MKTTMIQLMMMGNHQVKDNHENVKDDENDIMEDSGQSNE